jgi:uncharacterized protein DUF262
VYSRDWTVETIASQIKADNIDLNPEFQRSNAWNDQQRSWLIESLIINFPVPEIVLAEKRDQKQSFLVLDGKQRLMTIAGFIFPEEIVYWSKPILTNLRMRRDLEGLSFEELSSNPNYKDELRQFLNADVRCTIISNYESDDVLYEIFYRLNTTSVPLNPQELRQALFRGPFSDYLARISKRCQSLDEILGGETTNTARDADLILRFISFTVFGLQYKGNLKLFLDESLRTLNDEWLTYEGQVRRVVESFNESLARLVRVYGTGRVGRKFADGKWEPRFNKVLFEVEAYYFMFIPDEKITENSKNAFIAGFMELCENSIEFRTSIESTTKSPARYEARFRLFRDLVNGIFSTNIDTLPIKTSVAQPDLFKS